MRLKKAFWPIVAMAAIFGLGFVSALAVRPRPAMVEVHTGPSAATSIVVFLLAVLGLMVVAPVAGFLVVTAIRAYQATKRMEQTALLFGAKNTPRPSRPAGRPGSDGGTVIMISGGGQTPHVEDMRQ